MGRRTRRATSRAVAQPLANATRNSIAPWSAIDTMKPPTLGVVIPNSEREYVRLPETWTWPLARTGLGRDLHRLRDPVQRQVANEGQVGGRAREGSRGDVDRLGDGERGRRELIGLEALGPLGRASGAIASPRRTLS